MAPGIKRSIKEGFATANRSWAGIGVFVGSWLVIILLAILGVVLTNPPAELFQERTAGADLAVPPVQIPTQPEHAATQGATSTSEAQPTDVFGQLSTTEGLPAEQVVPAESPVTPPTPEPGAAARAETARRDRLAGEYFGRAWPVLLCCLLLVIAANLLISGGQIGYVAQRVTTGQARVSAFWVAGTRAFGPLLIGTLLSLAALVGLVAIGALIIAAFAALANVTPGGVDVVLGILGFALGLAALAGVTWLMVRLAFWFIVIVVDRLGPIAGLKRSFRASRGYWWKLVGLGLLMALISYGVWLPFGLLEWLGSRLGGAAASGISVAGNVLGFVASLYVGFAALAAYIRFYEDTKAIAGATASVGS